MYFYVPVCLFAWYFVRVSLEQEIEQLRALCVHVRAHKSVGVGVNLLLTGMFGWIFCLVNVLTGILWGI